MNKLFQIVNKARLVGLFLIISGLLWSSNFEAYNFLAGMITGAGVPFFLTGKFRFWTWKYPEHKH
ncbi:hypothetical protein [Salegentibacter sp. Hel_I_6]|uniref:hypothetical protein n=1 Tax=Salegentibacter sp. Hel_I_6 TaxID=1250278 RepID=UPI00056CF049|nr:hypothetical protein [Salegentibacter sp. Hel_I_6]